MMSLAPPPVRSRVTVERLPVKFVTDSTRVITRPFFLSDEARVRTVVNRVLSLSKEEVEEVFAQVMAGFDNRHARLERVFEEHGREALRIAQRAGPLSKDRRQLIGSYFTMEYSVASTALFNPSMVPHADQSGVPDGAKRFIMSLRATGEGHISSIVFRTGLILPNRTIQVDRVGRYARRARHSPDREYQKHLIHRKLRDMAVDKVAVDHVMYRLPDFFTLAELDRAIEEARQAEPDSFKSAETAEAMRWLARENYQLRMPDEADISEVVIFPQSENESRGIEDLRLVPFVEDDGSVTYFGTYSAFNGYRVLPQLIETRDFHCLGIHTLNGKCAQNKGMALFPRRINGHYAMCSRIDGENLYIMYSDIVQFWESAELLQSPKHPWEFMQLGNCGSPIETPAGWLVLTHGVGPMRSYSIGALLLDLDDPLKVIGHLDQPLIIPNEQEREGYVPNVVYSCGAMIHDGYLYIPYAMSDLATSIACVPLHELLSQLNGKTPH
jgi:predicted GH43/DUF377 family glycosyl hydrolase